MTPTQKTPLGGQSVLVVGGSSGIGLAVARELVARGADVTITGRDSDKLAAAARTLPGTARTSVLDAHDERSLAGFFAGLERIDHVISMVGDSTSGGFLTTTPETMRHVIHSKFWANWLIGRYAAERLREGGSITYTSGTGGRPHEISATYVANTALATLVQGLAVELAPRVRVNAVAPTFLGDRTSFWRDVPAEELRQAEQTFSEQVPLGRIAEVDEVASAYIFILSNGFLTGQVIAVDGGVMLRK